MPKLPIEDSTLAINTLSNGLRTNQPPIAPNEDIRTLQAIVKAYTDYYQPESPAEETFIEMLTMAKFRLHRTWNAEIQLIYRDTTQMELFGEKVKQPKEVQEILDKISWIDARISEADTLTDFAAKNPTEVEKVGKYFCILSNVLESAKKSDFKAYSQILQKAIRQLEEDNMDAQDAEKQNAEYMATKLEVLENVKSLIGGIKMTLEIQLEKILKTKEALQDSKLGALIITKESDRLARTENLLTNTIISCTKYLDKVKAERDEKAAKSKKIKQPESQSE